jgi:hypothetical protein
MAIPSPEVLNSVNYGSLYYMPDFCENEANNYLISVVGGVADNSSNYGWVEMNDVNVSYNSRSDDFLRYSNISYALTPYQSFFYPYVSSKTYRTNETNADIRYGIMQHGGARTMAVTVESTGLTEQSFVNLNWISPIDTVSVSEVLKNPSDEIRQRVHSLATIRTGTVLSWGAFFDYNDPYQAGALDGGDYRGIHIESETMVNVLDSSITSRTATSPGSCSDVQYGGVGILTGSGRNVPIRCAVLAHLDGVGGDPATVRFQGADHVADNYADISIPEGGSPAWVKSTDLFYLDSASSYINIGSATSGNKIDVFAMVDDNSTQNLYIYGLRAWIDYR